MRSLSRARPRRWPAALAGAASLLGLLFASPAVGAEPDAFTGALVAAAEALNELNFHSQVQAGLFAVAADGFQSGGAGLRLGVNALGVGGSLGGRMERYPVGAGALALADFELRPLPLLKSNLYRVVDPFVTAGLELGGGSVGFRATQTFGAGVDLGLFGRPETNREVFQPVLSIRYAFRLWQVPEELPQHLVMIGAASRLVF